MTKHEIFTVTSEDNKREEIDQVEAKKESLQVFLASRDTCETYLDIFLPRHLLQND